MPGASLETVQRVPVGRRAISRWALATSLPPNVCGDDIRRLLIGPALQDAGSWVPGTGSGSRSPDRDDPRSAPVAADLRLTGLSRSDTP
jgi:hypothetical protein